MSSGFPLLSGLGGRQLFIPDGLTPDLAKEDVQKSARTAFAQTPRALYIENMMPSQNGIQSVSFTEKVAALTTTGFDNIYRIQNIDGATLYFAFINGSVCILNGNTNIWGQIAFTDATPPVLVTKAYLHGETYIYFEKIGCYKYDPVGNTFDAVTLIGLIPTAITGICSANNYLLAYTDDTMYWSAGAVGDDLNFVPVTGNGAGSEQVGQAKGKFTLVLPLGDGYVIYTTTNAVYAAYSNNINFPWVFREIRNSAGVVAYDYVAYDNSSQSHFAWTTAGLMEITAAQAQLIFPEVTDFLASVQMEAFYSNIFLWYTGQKRIKLAYIGNRYLAISYGIGSLQYALIYDIALQRWGKLAKFHKAIFEFAVPSETNYVTYEQLVGTYADQGTLRYQDYASATVSAAEANRSIGVLEANGKISIVNFDASTADQSSVAVFGELRLTNNSYLEFLEAEIDQDKGTTGPLTLSKPKPITAQILNSIDGITYGELPVKLVEITSSSKAKKFRKRVTGIMQLLLLKGAMALSYLHIRVQPMGTIR